MKIGWRKLTVIGLVYVFVFYMSAAVKMEIPANNMELLKWTIGFFMGANMLKPLFNNTNINLGPPK